MQARKTCRSLFVIRLCKFAQFEIFQRDAPQQLAIRLVKNLLNGAQATIRKRFPIKTLSSQEPQ